MNLYKTLQQAKIGTADTAKKLEAEYALDCFLSWWIYSDTPAAANNMEYLIAISEIMDLQGHEDAKDLAESLMDARYPEDQGDIVTLLIQELS